MVDPLTRQLGDLVGLRMAFRGRAFYPHADFEPGGPLAILPPAF
jgi:hypothetical protein